MHKKFKRGIGCLLFVAILVTTFSQLLTTAKAVKVSDTAYNVNINGNYVFLGNKIAGSDEIGTEYYMTYTVQSAPVITMEQQGLVGSVDVTQRNTFEKGGCMRWTTKEEYSLFKEGYTYFIKFTAAKGGFTYDITRAKDDKVEKVFLDEYWGWPKSGFEHFGLWISGKIQANLIKVHCYDANGKDLGLMLTPGAGNIFEDVVMHKNAKVKHTYDIKVTDKYCVALSNLRVPTTERVYMEYSVEEADVLLSQEGVIMTDKPLTQYPFQLGAMRYNNYTGGSTNGLLLEPGASYIIRFDKTENGFDAIVQKTKNGERELFTFESYHKGSLDRNAQHFALWFGDANKFLVNFHLTDFKCYDDNGNNLAVQCNNGFEIEHFGEHEDYAGCEATYYCKETGNFLALYENKTIKNTVDSVTTDGTYYIMSGVMTAEFDGNTQQYDYLHSRITDSQGNVYLRLKQYTVEFVADGVEIPKQTLSNVTGYMVMRPTDPVVNGKEFESWVTGDGKTFDFNKIVTETTTLYAKYVGEDLMTEEVTSVPIIPIVAGMSVVVMVAVVGVIAIKVKGGARRGSKVEE